MARILFLFAHLHKGGMQRAVSNITKSLPASLELHLAYFGTDNPHFTFQAKHHYLAVPGSADDNLLKKAFNFLRRVTRLRNLVGSEQIETVISFGEIGNIYNLLTPHTARKLISIRVDIDSQLAEFGRVGPLVGKLLYGLYSRAERIICVSKELEEKLKRRAPATSLRAITINNLYPVDEIDSLSKQELPVEHRHLEGRRYILGVGSLIEQKGFDILIRVFAHLADQSAILVIIGDGIELEKLRQNAKSLNVLNRVIFVDHDTNPYRYMRRATIFALPSRYEGFPNVLIEAMACGAPVVAFDCPTGPREILGNNVWGKLVPQGDEHLFRLSIQYLLDDEYARIALGQLAKVRAADFRAEKIAGQWEAICRLQ